MSSLALAHDAARSRTRRGSAAALLAQRGSDLLLAIAMLALATVLLAYLAGAFSVDSWLALVGGREVWQGGIPTHETLTSLAHGARWVDQQWLSELASYGLYRIGGLGLLGVVNVALMVAGVGGAVAASRRLRGRPLSVMAALPFCIWLVFPSREVRTQAFVIPLFTGLLYLLAVDSRMPSRRVYFSLPILILWANLHGTVSLAVLLVVLRALTYAWERRRLLLRSARAWVRPLVLTLGAPMSILMTPYGFGAIAYYRTMLLGSAVRHAVTEWQPITSASVVAIPFFLLAAVAVWSFGRFARRTTLWDKLALLAMAAGSVMVIRNLLFFGLCALVVLPLSIRLGGFRRGSPQSAGRRAVINGVLVSGAVLTLLLATVSTLAAPASHFELRYQRMGVLGAVEQATRRNPSLKVLADVRFSDWLLWRDPALRGQVANDARFELLSPRQLHGLQLLAAAIGPDWKAGARGFRLIVLDRKYTPYAAQGFLREPGRRVLYDDGERLVILRDPREAE